MRLAVGLLLVVALTAALSSGFYVQHAAEASCLLVRVGGVRLSPREWVAVTVSVCGLLLLTLSRRT